MLTGSGLIMDTNYNVASARVFAYIAGGLFTVTKGVSFIIVLGPS